MKRKSLTEVLQIAQQQGATHVYNIGVSMVRVYREKGSRWQGRSIDVDAKGCLLLGTWRDLSGNLPQQAQYIPNVLGAQ